MLKFWENPHQGTREPISALREYFGDQITMYVAFLSFYTRWLIYPAVVGLGFQICELHFVCEEVSRVCMWVISCTRLNALICQVLRHLGDVFVPGV